jgi:hypothetical protein
MASLFVVPTFRDLKQKSSGKGGLSDGGVINRTVILKEAGQSAVTVEIAPPPGVAYAGLMLRNPAEGEIAALALVNFSSGMGDIAQCFEYFVTADGTEVKLGESDVAGPQTVEGFETFFSLGGVLQYPNKLRYKLNPSKGPAVAGRLSLKYTLMQFDRPSDQG